MDKFFNYYSARKDGLIRHIAGKVQNVKKVIEKNKLP
jgi:hypothetical protein